MHSWIWLGGNCASESWSYGGQKYGSNRPRYCTCDPGKEYVQDCGGTATIVVCWLESPATLGVFVVAAAAAVDEEDAMIRTQPNIKAVDGSYCCDAQREWIKASAKAWTSVLENFLMHAIRGARGVCVQNKIALNRGWRFTLMLNI